MTEAVCVITHGTINGFIIFKQQKNRVKITIDLKGVPVGKHGFHIHTSGDLRHGCKSLCSHYNPYNKNHGGKRSRERHVGDLGNLETDKKGNISITMYDTKITLDGKYSIIGRSVVIHDKEDDLGKGNNIESLITGNAGKRIGCGVVGFSENC